MKKRLRKHFKIIPLRRVFSVKIIKFNFSLEKLEKIERKTRQMKEQSMWKMCRNKPIMQVRIIAVCFI